MYRSIFIALLSVLAANEVQAASKAAAKKPSERREMGKINPIETLLEYERIAEGKGPIVIVFTSKTCTACDQHEEALAPVAEEYTRADFYSFDVSGDELKSFIKKHKIAGYPTTQFILKGKIRSELGSMSQKELDNIVYEMVTGKRKPVKRMIPPEPTKKAAETKTEAPAKEPVAKAVKNNNAQKLGAASFSA